ncbi:MAG: hypothetical protein ASARMPREDX12_005064 [Alectoria sarmentosa]|nr:MAG: hypothetical protein ASARMPREDX12_005064 [Alectoria sarmentosa]
MLSDNAIQPTWQLCGQQDFNVSISVRKNDDSSSSSSRALSYFPALTARRIASSSSRVQVPEIPLITAARQVFSSVDVVLGTPLADLSKDEKVLIEVESAECFALSKEYVMAWIELQVQDGRNLTEIKVTTIDGRGFPTDVQLDCHELESTIAQLRLDDPAFTQNRLNFIRDFQYFDSDRGARERLESTEDEFHLEEP